jgi:hypothetical protein
MRAITIFSLFALLLIVGCGPANYTSKFFDNRNNTEYKINAVLYKDGIVVNINDTRTVVGKFSKGQKEVRAQGKYLSHQVTLWASKSQEYNMIADIDYWFVIIDIDGNEAAQFDLGK